MKHHNYYVYILLCSDGSYYTGVTNDLDRRFAEHVSGDDPNCYTFKRRPLVLKYYEYYRVIDDAILREKQIKRWSRAKKQALVNEDGNKLTELSRSYTKD
jgi:putative endonuclease